MQKKIDLSVIIPAYNEQTNLEQGALDAVLKFLKAQKFTWEIVVLNDGSSDNTLSILKKYSKDIILVDNPHLGKAGGVISGALKASGQVILFTDMDQSTPLSEINKFLPKFSEGYDIVIGTRTKHSGAPFYRQVLAHGLVLVRSVILNLPYKDTQCGFKAFSKESATKIFPILNKVHPPVSINQPNTNPGFDLEILYLARKFSYKVAEVNVDWKYRDSKRVSFIKDSINGIKELLLVRYRSLTHVYKI